MKRMLLILLFAAAGLVAACGPGSTSSPSSAIDAPVPSDAASEEVSMAPDASASTSP
jgi:hypothetical protein